MPNLDSRQLEGVLSLSCVESYFLYLLKERTENWGIIYYDCVLSFRQVLQAFSTGMTDYTHFNLVKRVHRIAREYGILNVEHIRDFPSDEVREADSIVVRVDPSYMELKYGKRAWRDDHYILLRLNQKMTFNYLNDVPRDCGEIMLSEIGILGITSASIFRIVGDIDAFSDTFYSAFYDRINKSFVFTDLGIDIDQVQLRDVVGILRVLRRRAVRFLDCYGISLKGVDTYLEKLEAIFAHLEYIRLRGKKINREEKERIVMSIDDMDAFFWNQIRREVKAL